MKKMIVLISLLVAQVAFAKRAVTIPLPYKERMTACFNTEIQDRCDMVHSDVLRPVHGMRGQDFLVATTCGARKVTEYFVIRHDDGPDGCKVVHLVHNVHHD